jgi:hypothetical protein
MLHEMKRRYRASLTNGMLAPIAAMYDLARPSILKFLGEPLNGQSGRRAMIEEILQVFPCERIIETGTFRGSTAQYFSRLHRGEVISIEAVGRYHWYSRFRLRGERRIRLVRGDSRSVLRTLGRDRHLTQLPTLFYLDAHWGDDLPLAEEIQEIARNWRSWIAVIDDFKVPNDAEYAYDDYGPGKALDLPYLQSSGVPALSLFWPRLRAVEESGLRRGCVVVTSDAELASRLASQCATLIPHAA